MYTALTHEFEDLVQMDEVEDQEDSKDNGGDDGTQGESDIEQWFISSNKSLIDQSNEMYDSDVELDYEN